jgi:hypothetical protein
MVMAACSGDGEEATDDPCRVFTAGEVMAHLNLPPDVGGGQLVPGGHPVRTIGPAVAGMNWCHFTHRFDEANRVDVVDLWVGLVSGGPQVARAIFDKWRQDALGRDEDDGERTGQPPAQPVSEVRGLGVPALSGGRIVGQPTAGVATPALLVLAEGRVLAVAIPVTDPPVTDDETRLERQRRLAAKALDRDLKPVGG